MRTAVIRPDVLLDVHQIMPNHIHLIVYVPTAREIEDGNERRLFRAPKSLSSLMAQFKANVTHRVRELLNDESYKVWQRGFHDRVIRNEKELERIRTYIIENPNRWASDPLNPRGV